MSRPRLLLIDELSLGLMPKAVDLCYSVLRQLRDDGITILLVEQGTDRALAFADQVCVLESGRSVMFDSAQIALKNPELIAAYMGTHSGA